MTEETFRYYVVVYLAVDQSFDSFVHVGKLETLDDIEDARLSQGEDAIIINWKRLQ